MDKKITGVFCRSGSYLTALSLETTTPEAIQYRSTVDDIGAKYFINVELSWSDDEDKRHQKEVTLDLSSIFARTRIGRAYNATWDVVAEKITDAIVLSYGVETPTFDDAARSLRHVSLLNTFDFDVGFTSFKSPSERNISTYRWRLTDLVVTKRNAEHPVKLENCLCIVNGLTSRPIMFNDELYIKDGALFAHSTTYMHHPSILLMDFEGLGGMRIVPFSECAFRPKNAGGDRVVVGADVEFEIKTAGDLTKKTICVVVAHTFFFPEAVKVTSKSTVVISPHVMPLNDALLKKNACSQMFVDGTSVVYTEESVAHYMQSTMLDSAHHGAFFVILDTPKVHIQRTHLARYAHNCYTGVANTDGLLFDAAAQSILTCTKVPYDSVTDFYTSRGSSLYKIPPVDDYYGRQLGVEKFKCPHQHFTDNFQKLEDMYILRIAR